MNLPRFSQCFFFLVSFLIVGFAQPDWSVVTCILASSIGYAFFWKGVLYNRSTKGRFFSATLWFALVEALHLNWFMADRYVGFYIYPFLVLLFLALGVQFGIITLFIKDPREMGVVQILGIAGGWVILEWSRLFFLSGFSWDPIGLALSGTTSSMQLASIFGVYGLSFWIIFTNLLALRMLMSPSWGSITMWGAVMSVPYLFGSMHLYSHARRMQSDSTPPLSALLVQTSLIPDDKLPVNGSTPLAPNVQWERILALLAPYLNTPTDLIVFSEAVVPYGTHYPIYPITTVKETFETFFESSEFLSIPVHEKEGNRFWAQGIANAFQADLVIGFEDVDFNSQNKGIKAYNAAFLFRPFSRVYDRYEKRILVPMGEYIPFNWCKKILSKYGIMDSFTPGDGAKVFHTKRVPVGLSICYEETYGGLMRESRQEGARLLINLTNDVWYPNSRLPLIHFYHGRLRAVETGIPLLRSCNTGVTCGVDSLGRVVGMLDYECPNQNCSPGILSVSLPLYHYPTFYMLVGDKPVVYSSSLLFTWLCIISLIKRRYLRLNNLNISPLRKN